ncbi:hypothetical protein WS68_03965 [Burkholderia sp. TSV86]|nr:hypothetical protein WS68_03965 [Burkholderia sp. TSV86]
MQVRRHAGTQRHDPPRGRFERSGVPPGRTEAAMPSIWLGGGRAAGAGYSVTGRACRLRRQLVIG